VIYVCCLRDKPDTPFMRVDWCAWIEIKTFVNPRPQKAGFAAAASAR
jgi:hypothetical protein